MHFQKEFPPSKNLTRQRPVSLAGAADQDDISVNRLSTQKSRSSSALERGSGFSGCRVRVPFKYAGMAVTEKMDARQAAAGRVVRLSG